MCFKNLLAKLKWSACEHNYNNFFTYFLQLINGFSKAAYTKAIYKKSVAFLYTNKGVSEGKIKKTIPFAITPKRTKYLGINLTKGVKNLYTENFKALIKKLENTWINRKLLHIHAL